VFLSSRSRVVGIATVVAVCLTVAVIVLLRTGARTSAAPLPRGGVVTVPDRPPALNADTVRSQLNGVRKEAGLPALQRSSCLDGVAASAAPADPSTPASANASRHASASGCGAHPRTGWISGADRTGTQMVAAALTRQPSGPSPLLDRSARHIGLALVPQHAGSALTGYALCWAVSP
jgi:hypothetical protein